ncbi:MAG: diguanylate cyclase, partial [Myxococcales bacterium]
DLGVEAYLGVPLITPDGDVLGALCAIDGAPHCWSDDDLQVLSDLSAIVMSEVRLREASRELAASNERLRRLADAAFEGIAVSERGRIVDGNEAFAQMFGYEPHEMIGLPAQVFVHPSEHTRIVNHQSTGFEGVYQTTGQRRDGTTFPLEVRGRMVPWGDRTVRITAMNDLTERVRQMKFVELLRATATEANEARSVDDALQACLERVAEAMHWPVGHVHLVEASDPDAPLLVASDLWHLPDPGRFEPFRAATTPLVLAPGAGLAGQVLASGQARWTTDVQTDPSFLRQDSARACGLHGGFAFPVLVGPEVVAVLEFYSSHVEAPDQPLLAVMANVGTQLGRVVERERTHALLEQRAAEIQALSLRDELTGLHNRRGFLELARQGVRLADRSLRPALVLFIDLNGMKPINDRFGHEEGDRALRAAAAALRATFRDSDVVARLGGDEFAVFAPDVGPDHEDFFRDRLQAHVAAFNDSPGDRPWRLSLSTGVTTYDPRERRPIEAMLEEADARMYEAKRLRARLGGSSPGRSGSA